MRSSAEGQPDWLNVSRETYSKLEELLALATKWNRKINLVSSSSLLDGWTRHILDSAQLWGAAGVQNGLWLDIGSGGGFPGLVIAIIADECAPNMRISLIESDRRKSVFLSEAARQLGLKVDVHSDRVEKMKGLAASVISARAMAPLDELLGLAKQHLGTVGVAVFPKGQNFEVELAGARKHWRFDCDVIQSNTDPRAVVLRIENIQNV